MTIPIHEQHAFVRQSQGVMRMALKTRVLPALKAFAVIGGARNCSMVVEISGAHEGDEVAFGGFIQRGFVESDFVVRPNWTRVVPRLAFIGGDEQMGFGFARRS